MGRSQVLVAALALLGGSSAAPLEARAPPATFPANPAIGYGGSVYRDSAHFRVYGRNDQRADTALRMLETAYDCYVNALGYRSTGLSFNDATDGDGPWTKINVYSVATLPGAAGVMHSDAGTGMAWLEVQQDYLTTPGVVVHEFGHGVHYHQKTWVNQGRTGAWWETFANWFADTYATSNLCATSRNNNGIAAGATMIDLRKTIGDSFQVIVDGTAGSGNYYQAWPFFTYLTNNPDNLSGLGRDTLRLMMTRYAANSNETPLHTLQRVAGSTSVARIVGRYWARMAYVDLAYPSAHQAWLSQRGSLNYANVDATGNGSYRVKAARRPQYMGANIVPLRATSSSIRVTIQASGAYTATLAIYRAGPSTRYVDVVNGAASATLASGEQATLVVANTPSLILFDPFSLSTQARTGLDYSFILTGATVA
ncbi:hypothetical protein B0I35DRAFT_395515 [Stachybotrys elegans]|uniref:Uncharacterized protein n=1 Tax=Stachybotrys elegans TaxID=80388 RepID=A0A8K0WQF0_9HYPO|nr:hypothetical protein B0I35DRAFT_395515 [Stachybotrys elegans]